MKQNIAEKFGLPGKLLLTFATLFLFSFSNISVAQHSCVKADFEYSVDHNTNTVKFAARASSNAILFVWDFGTGTTVNGSTTTKHFSAAGTYKVCLTVYGYDKTTSKRCSVTVCKKIVIQKCDLRADFDLKSDGLTIKAEAKSSSKHAVYGWTLGDGNSERGDKVKHTYAKDGKYTICLFVKDTITGCTAKICKDVALRDCDLKVDFEFAQDGSDFKFRAKASESNATFIWDFGDGKDGKGSEIRHSYDKPGHYKVCVTAILTTSTGTKRCTATVCKRVVVPRKDPCDLKADYKYEIDGREIKVKAKANEEGVQYYWSWGDGTSSHGQTAKHKYTKYGVYEVCLIVFNPKTHCKVCVCKKIVIEQPCHLKAKFKYRVDGNKVIFKARSNSKNAVYGWKFGDGDDGKGNPIRHEYSKPGHYKVTLIVYDKVTGCKVEIVKRIIINRNQTIPDAEADLDVDLNSSAEVRVDAPTWDWNATAFPVPSKNGVTFTSDEKLLTHADVYSQDGVKVLDVDLETETQEEIDITTLPTGFYYAHLTAVDGTVKIVKFLKN